MTNEGRTWTLDEAADLLGVHTMTVWRIAGIWHPPVGTGRKHPPLTATDIKMVRACLKFYGRPTGTRHHQVPHRELMIAAHDAIRDNPAAIWMLVTAPTVTVYTTAEAATEAWLASGRPVGRLVRIDGVDDPMPNTDDTRTGRFADHVAHVAATFDTLARNGQPVPAQAFGAAADRLRRLVAQYVTDDLDPSPAEILRELRHFQVTPSASEGQSRLDVLHWGGEAMAHITWHRGDDSPPHWLLTEAGTDVVGVPGTLGECLAEVARWDADLQNRHEQETITEGTLRGVSMTSDGSGGGYVVNVDDTHQGK